MVLVVASLVACGLPLSNIFVKPFTFSNSTSSLNSRKTIYNYRFSPSNLMPDSATRLRKSRGRVIFSRRLKWKWNSRICPCGFCTFHLNSPQMDEKSVLAVLEAVLEAELLAAANLRVRTFYEFNQRYRAKGIEADFARAYLTNVSVAKELHRNGIGTPLVMQALKIAQKWGNFLVSLTSVFMWLWGTMLQKVGNDAAKSL